MNEPQAQKQPSVDHGDWFMNMLQVAQDEGNVGAVIALTRQLKADMEAACVAQGLACVSTKGDEQ